MFSKQVKEQKKQNLTCLTLQELMDASNKHGENDPNFLIERITDYSIHRSTNPLHIFNGLNNGDYDYVNSSIVSKEDSLPRLEKIYNTNDGLQTYDSTTITCDTSRFFYSLFDYVSGHFFVQPGGVFCTNCVKYITTSLAEHSCYHNFKDNKHFCSVCNFQTNHDDIFHVHINSADHDERFEFLRSISLDDSIYVTIDGIFKSKPVKKYLKIDAGYIKNRLDAMSSSPFMLPPVDKLCTILERSLDKSINITSSYQRECLKMQMITLHAEINTGFKLCRKPTLHNSCYSTENCLQAVKYYLYRQIDNTNKKQYDKYQEICNIDSYFQTYDSDMLTCCSICDTTHKIKAYHCPDKLIQLLDDIIGKL